MAKLCAVSSLRGDEISSNPLGFLRAGFGSQIDRKQCLRADGAGRISIHSKTSCGKASFQRLAVAGQQTNRATALRFLRLNNPRGGQAANKSQQTEYAGKTMTSEKTKLRNFLKSQWTDFIHRLFFELSEFQAIVNLAGRAP